MRTARNGIFLLLVLITWAAAQGPDLRLVLTAPNAVAVAGVPESQYYVLSSDDAVYRYIQVGSDFRYVGQFFLQGPKNGIDMTLAQVDQQESVIVTQWMQGASQGSIYRYASGGKVLKVWTVQHVPTGIVFDPATRLAYFATYDSNELYAVRLDVEGAQPTLVSNIVDATNVGALALDSEQQIIYAADRRGSIFAVDLHSKRVTQLKASFALPVALLFYSPTKSLYVADEVKRKIYAVSIVTQRVQVVADSFQSPSGLAVGPGNSVVISDRKSGGVLVMRVAAGVTLGQPKSQEKAKRQAVLEPSTAPPTGCSKAGEFAINEHAIQPLSNDLPSVYLYAEEIHKKRKSHFRLLKSAEMIQPGNFNWSEHGLRSVAVLSDSDNAAYVSFSASASQPVPLPVTGSKTTVYFNDPQDHRSVNVVVCR